VREHLLFYGRIKGIGSSSSTLDQAVSSTVTRVGLQGKEEVSFTTQNCIRNPQT